MNSKRQNLGCVVIGRNEGERLRACLKSLRPLEAPVVYVDSGSSDDSVALARSMGADVVELDAAKPFTAARSRNAGIQRLRDIAPMVEFVQVIDGDCELLNGWIEPAITFLTDNPDVAIACGRRRERAPTASIYQQLCEMEWNTQPGDTAACGGDAIIRLKAIQQVNGYDESLIAGEEPELCVRLRMAGWRIHRIDVDMTLHDARIDRFSQWWRRSVRSGHAFAEGYAVHGSTPERYCQRQVRSILLYTLAIPALAIGLAWVTWGASLLLFVAYVWLWKRIRDDRRRHGDPRDHASLYADYCVLGKFAELLGMCRYWLNRLRGRRTSLIEYRGVQTADRLHMAGAVRT